MELSIPVCLPADEYLPLHVTRIVYPGLDSVVCSVSYSIDSSILQSIHPSIGGRMVEGVNVG